MTASTEIDHRVVDAVQRSADRIAVADRPIEQVQARAGRRRRRQRTISTVAVLALVVGGGLVTASIIGRDEPTVSTVAGFNWTRIELPFGSDGAAGMLAVDGTGPFFGVEYVGPGSEQVSAAISLDGIVWRPLNAAPPLVGSPPGFPPALTSVGDRVALVGRLAADHDGRSADELVLTTSDDRGATWRTTALETDFADIRSVAVALQPDGVLIAFSGDAAPAPGEAGSVEMSPTTVLQQVDRSGTVTPLDTADLPGVASWSQVALDESTDGIVLAGGRSTAGNEWAGNVYVRQFADGGPRWSGLGPALPGPLQSLQLEGDTTLAIGIGSMTLPDVASATGLHAQVRGPWTRGPWRSAALDELIPTDLRRRATFTTSVNRQTVAMGPGGLVIAAELVSRDQQGALLSGDEEVSRLQALHSVDGTTWAAIHLDELVGAEGFFARPLMRNDGSVIVAVYVPTDREGSADPAGDPAAGAAPWRTIVLVGTPAG